jgi:type II pantothenate kinase
VHAYDSSGELTVRRGARQIGGSLAKVVYFTRATSKPTASSSRSSEPLLSPPTPQRIRTPSPPGSPVKPNGTLGPRSLSQRYLPLPVVPDDTDTTLPISALKALSILPTKKSTSPYPPFQTKLRRPHSTTLPPGGKLNFIKFETTNLTDLITFLRTLIESSARSNGVPLELMKNHVKIMATGGGAHKFYERLRGELGVEVRREEEMECLVLGLGFVMEIPGEVFWYSDELVQAISHPSDHPPVISIPSPSSSVPIPLPTDLPRPSPNPPQYSLSFDLSPAPAQFPFLLVNIGSGVSIIKVDDYGKFERISGTSLGGGTLWGLLSLLTGARSFDGKSSFSSL